MNVVVVVRFPCVVIVVVGIHSRTTAVLVPIQLQRALQHKILDTFNQIVIKSIDQF